MPKEEGINIPIKEVRIPKFHEFASLTESVDAEMTLYSEIASRVDRLKEIYGEKAIGKTGMMKALLSVNELILTGKKEKQPQEQPQEKTQQPQESSQEDEFDFDAQGPQEQPQEKEEPTQEEGQGQDLV